MNILMSAKYNWVNRMGASGFASVFVRLRVRFNPDERLAMTGFTDRAKRKRAPAHWAHGGMISDARPNSACGTKPKAW